MKYKVITLSRAKKEMADILCYISKELDAPGAARSLLSDIEAEILGLEFMPKKFALVSDERLSKLGIRLIPVKNYHIFYVVDEPTKTINIVSVKYGKRNWASLL